MQIAVQSTPVYQITVSQDELNIISDILNYVEEFGVHEVFEHELKEGVGDQLVKITEAFTDYDTNPDTYSHSIGGAY